MDMSIEAAAERWASLDFEHPAIARAFGIPQDAPGALFALYPFRVDRIGGVWHVLAAWPCPRSLGVIDDDHRGIVAVMAWNPKTNAVQTLGDPQPQIVGRVDRDYSAAAALYGDARAFFRAWIANRLGYWRYVAQGGPAIHGAAGIEPDMIPGALAVGDIRHIRLPIAAMPCQVECIGINPGAVNRRIQELAALPYATARTQVNAA